MSSSRGVCNRYHEQGSPQPSDYGLFGPDSMQTCRHDFVMALRVSWDQSDLLPTAAAQPGNGRASSSSTGPSSEAHSGMRQKLSVSMDLSGAVR